MSVLIKTLIADVKGNKLFRIDPKGCSEGDYIDTSYERKDETNLVNEFTNESLKEHLISRGMNPDMYNIVYDQDEQLVTFYLHNGVGDIVGYQQYKPNQLAKKANDPRESRYFTYLPRGKPGVFGVEQLDKSKRTIYIVEGIFKAATLHRLGFNAIAVLTDSPKQLNSWFRILKANHDLVAIGDPDPAGERLVRVVKNGVTSPLDLDEMEDQDVIKLLGAVMNR